MTRTVVPDALPVPLTDAEEKRLARARRRAQAAALAPEEPRRARPRASTAVRPVGSTVIRPRVPGRGGPYRYVKVQMHGTQMERWRRRAVVRWEEAHGPVPEGLVVLAKNGDSLDDDLANLMVGTRDDVLFMATQRPGFDNHSGAWRTANAEKNHARGAARRLRGPLSDRWYLVDVDARRTWNVAAKSRWDAVAMAVVVPPWRRTLNGAAWYSSLAGWPGQPDVAAAALSVLVDARRPLRWSEVVARTEVELCRVGIKPPSKRHSWHSVSYYLRKAGLLETRRGGRHEGIWAASAEAVRTRQAPSRLLPVWSADLALERFQGFTWVNERGQEYQRERGDWAEFLARATATEASA